MAQLFIQMSYTVGILLGALIFLQALPRRGYFALRFSAGVAISLIAGWMFLHRYQPTVTSCIATNFFRICLHRPLCHYLLYPCTIL